MWQMYAFCVCVCIWVQIYAHNTSQLRAIEIVLEIFIVEGNWGDSLKKYIV